MRNDLLKFVQPAKGTFSHTFSQNLVMKYYLFRPPVLRFNFKDNLSTYHLEKRGGNTDEVGRWRPGLLQADTSHSGREGA